MKKELEQLRIFNFFALLLLMASCNFFNNEEKADYSKEYFLMDIYPSRKIMPFTVIINFKDKTVLIHDISSNISSNNNHVVKNQILKIDSIKFINELRLFLQRPDFCKINKSNDYYTDGVLVHFQYYNDVQSLSCVRDLGFSDSEMECIRHIMTFLIKNDKINSESLNFFYPI